MMTLSHIVRRVSLLIGSAVVLCLPLLAQETKPDVTDDTRAYLEVLRSQFNADKVATINHIMKFSTAEADKFWPIYREYEKALAVLGDRRLELMRDFLKEFSGPGLSDATSNALAKRWFANLKERTRLWEKYHRKISKRLSPMRAAQFLQLEHQIALLVDLSIASEMPALTPGGADVSK